MSYRINPLSGRGRNIISIVPCAYRGLAFFIAVAQIFLFPSNSYHLIDPVILVTGLGIYSLLVILRQFRLRELGRVSLGLLIVDVAVCIFLVVSTAGLYSPFLLYTLAPLLTSALLLNRWATFGLTVFSLAYVIGGHVVNPFFPTELALPEWSYFFVYTVAVSLGAALPYLTNVNLRHYLQSEDILRERQRLSREIHDGVAQTLSALSWQVQLLQRRLTKMGIELDEAEQLGTLAEKAGRDTREALELLRSYNGHGNLLPCLKDYLGQLKQDANINCTLNVGEKEVRLETPVELQLLRICQEALSNIRKHSGAGNVAVDVQAIDGHLEVDIADDGRGFDILSYYRGGVKASGHGVSVMRERAESVGGKLVVVSLPGRGTHIKVEVPTDHGDGGWIWTRR